MSMRAASWMRIGVLGIGVVSAWAALIVQFRVFYAAYGTFAHASTGLATNPFLTPCLYGSLAFLGAFVWASILHLRPSVRSDIWLSRLLLFGVVFAGVVSAYDCVQYYHIFSLGIPVVCDPNTNPFFTACFRGFLFFIAAYILSFWTTPRSVPAAPTIS